MENLLHKHLQRQALVAPPLVAGAHLDEDALAAFTEGSLSEVESKPIISHLVDCAFCRRITVRLMNLAVELGETRETSVTTTSPEPGRIRRLLESLTSRILPASDEMAVFAYHAPAEDFQKSEQPSEEEKSQDNGKEEA